MPEIISDTIPIQYLHQLKLLNLLARLYDHVIVPQAVSDELAVGRALGNNLPDPMQLSWMEVRDVEPDPMLSKEDALGAGERQVLSLGLRIPEHLLLMDDAVARRFARQRAMRFTGTLGVLVRAKSLGLLERVAPHLDILSDLGFRMTPDVAAIILRQAGE